MNAKTDRHEIIRRMVLNSICDDFENVDQVILRDTAAWGPKLGLTVTRPDVVRALTSLVADGMAKAYLLSHSQDPLDAMPDISEPEERFETYFFITPKGMEVHRADENWPYEDDEDDVP
jgi:hypothetical protein